MGKRSSFERRPQDFYPTPPEAVAPLLPHLPKHFTYIEPFAGDGALISALPGKCVWASDIEPRELGIRAMPYDTALVLAPEAADYVISNPPWRRDLLHNAIARFSGTWPTWFLLDADWMQTSQADPYLRYCDLIVAIGRVRWIPGSRSVGKDNCCWYRFQSLPVQTRFVGRA